MKKPNRKAVWISFILFCFFFGSIGAMMIIDTFINNFTPMTPGYALGFAAGSIFIIYFLIYTPLKVMWYYLKHGEQNNNKTK